MALTPVTQVVPDAPQPSALDNAAKILGIVGSLGGVAANAYNVNINKEQLDLNKAKEARASGSNMAPSRLNNPASYNLGINNQMPPGIGGQ